MNSAHLREARTSLAPVVPGPLEADASVFHRALIAWNAAHYRTATFDDLTVDEQRVVYLLAARMDREAHPCRK